MRGDAGEDVILGNEIGHLFLQSQKRAENDLEPEAGEVDPALVGRKLFHDLAAPEYLMPAIAAPRAALGCGPIAFRLGDDRGREHAFDAPGVGVGQFAGNIQRRPRKAGSPAKDVLRLEMRPV